MTSKLRVNNDTEFNVTGSATKGKYTINCTGKGTNAWCEVERDGDSEHCVQLTISGVPWMDNNISVYVRIRDKNGSKNKRIGVSGSGYKDAENNWSTNSSRVINGLKCSCSIPDTRNPEGKVRIEVDDTGFNLWGQKLEKEGNAATNQVTKKEKFEAARLKFEEAERTTTDQSNKTIYRNNQAIMLNKIGDILFDSGDYTGAVEKFGAAYAKCSSGYSSEQTFRANRDKAQAEIDALTLKGQAETDFTAGRYADAKAKADQAFAKSTVQIRKSECTSIATKAQTEITARAAFEQAERLYSSGDYDGALNKYREAHTTSRVIAVKTIYNNGIIKARAEIEAASAFEQAERLYSSGDYDGALNKYREAHTTSRVIAVKTIYNNGIIKARAEIEAASAFEQAERLYSSGDYDGALSKYREAHTTSRVIAVKTIYNNGITKAEVEIESRLAEERGDNIVAAANELSLEKLREALAEYRQASERTIIKENKDRCLGKVEDLELMITIKESEEQFRQDQDRREQIELDTVFIRSLKEFEEELIKKVIEESRKTYSHELCRQGLDHKERGDEEYDAEDEGAAHSEYRNAYDRYKEAMQYGKPEGIRSAFQVLREAFSKLNARKEVSDIDIVLDELGGSVPVVTDIQTQNPSDYEQGPNILGDAEHNDFLD
jgi:tetratricopeptide (TPR) repeat protein